MKGHGYQVAVVGPNLFLAHVFVHKLGLRKMCVDRGMCYR